MTIIHICNNFFKLQDVNNSDAACASLITEFKCSAACRQVHSLSTVYSFVLMMNISRGHQVLQNLIHSS